MMQYPLTLTWTEIAELPRAPKHFDWDDTMIDPEFTPTFAAHIANYMSDLVVNPDESEADKQYTMLPRYLHDVGFVVTNEGVTVKSRLALLLADALLHAVMYEYDAPDMDRVYPDQPPTWKLFNLSGDDTVDYYGTQPTCLTNLLLDTHIAYEAGLK